MKTNILNQLRNLVGLASILFFTLQSSSAFGAASGTRSAKAILCGGEAHGICTTSKQNAGNHDRYERDCLLTKDGSFANLTKATLTVPQSNFSEQVRTKTLFEYERQYCATNRGNYWLDQPVGPDSPLIGGGPPVDCFFEVAPPGGPAN